MDQQQQPTPLSVTTTEVPMTPLGGVTQPAANHQDGEQQVETPEVRRPRSAPGVATTVATSPGGGGGGAPISGGGGWLCFAPCRWLRSNTGVHRAILACATLLVTTVLVASPVLFLISSAPGGCPRRAPAHLCSGGMDTGVDDYTGECTGPRCIAVGRLVSTAVDWEANPCKDFHSYACGNAEIEGDRRVLVGLLAAQARLENSVRVLLTNDDGVAHQLYAECLEEEPSSEPAMKLLKRLGGYLPPGALGPGDLTPLIARLLNHDGPVLVDIRLDRNGQLLVEPPRPPNSFIATPAPAEIRVLEDLLPERDSLESKQREMKLVQDFATHLAAASNAIELDASTFTITGLQDKHPMVQWGALFREVVGWNGTLEDTVYVFSPDYLTAVASLVGRTPRRVVHNAVLAIYARDRLLQLAEAERGTEWCAKIISEVYPRAVMSVYVRRLPHGRLMALKRQAGALLRRLRITVEERVRAAPWPDAPTRNAALSRLSALKVIFPEDHDPGEEPLRGGIEGGFFGTVIEGYKRRRYMPAAPPILANVVYDAADNTLVVPAPVLVDGPHAAAELPLLTFATLGTVIARELIRTLDVRGNSALDPNARLRLEARVECVTRQQAGSSSGSGGHNGTRAPWPVELGALRTSALTWRRWQASSAGRHQPSRLPDLDLTAGQLFHVAAAQLQCGNHWHRNAAAMNSADFADAFACPSGSPMNPTNKCATW